MKRTFSVLAALAAAPFATAYVTPGSAACFAQGPTTQVLQQTQQVRASNDTLIAHCIAWTHQEEIALSRFAKEKAESSEVKKFADMMISDHEEALKRLPQKFQTGHTNLSDERDRSDRLQNRQRSENQNQVGNQGGNGVVENQPVPQTNAPGQPTRTVAGHPQNPSQDALGIHTEIARQCLSDAKEKLGSLENEEFDKCFMGMQVAMHQAAKSKLTVFERHASAELKEQVNQALKTTTEHLEKAEEILKGLASDGDEK